MIAGRPRQDELYEEAAAAHGAALDRLARSYELDADKRRDLLQEIHLALWRSFEGFDGHCSVRTWIYRVAQNVAASHVIRNQRQRLRPHLSLDDIEEMPSSADGEVAAGRQESIDKLHALIASLNPLEHQMIVLYLEGFDAVAIGEVTGISSGNVATKIHRIKKILADRFEKGRRQ
jgi:RNA polymerase sigma-70 factor (ECF subfamily)